MTDPPSVVTLSDQLSELPLKLWPVMNLYREACEQGEQKAGKEFFRTAVWLIGLLWIKDVIGENPCWTYRGELATAWWQFRRARRQLGKTGISPALERWTVR